MSHPVYVETYGPEVCDLNAAANYHPDPEQELFLNLLFAINSAGKSATFENVLIGPRQNLKTGAIKQAEIGWLFLMQEPLVIHSAHELDTTEEAFSDLRMMIEDTPALSRFLDTSIGRIDSRGITSGNGKWLIHLIDDEGRKSKMKYKARSVTGGRGLTANKLVLDEAFAVHRRMIGSLYPTLTAVPDPQILAASSAGMLTSDWLRDLRNRGRAGIDPRLLYMEYGDDVKVHGGCKAPGCRHEKPPNNPPGCALDDERRWKRFMTALGRRITIETIRDMRRSMPPDEFAREFMVWWEDPIETVLGNGRIDTDVWKGRANPNVPQPDRAVLFVAVDGSGKTGAIAAAGPAPGGKTVILVTTFYDVGQMPDAVKRLTEKRTIVEVVLVPNTQAGTLIPALVQAQIRFETMNLVEYGQAHGAFLRGIEDGDLVHVGQQDLDAQIPNIGTKFIGGLERFIPLDPGRPISAVEAAAGAYYRWGLIPATPPPVPRAITTAEPAAVGVGAGDINHIGF